MRPNRTRRMLLLGAACVLSIAFLAGLAVRQDRNSSVQSVPAVAPEIKADSIVAPQPVVAGIPVRVQIPRIHVNAKIDHMGLTKFGDMEAPTTIANGGWYKHGPNPGNEGSAVIAGHKTGLKGVPGIFSELGKLQKGDTITVIDDKDQSITFIVREIRSYDQSEKPAEVFGSVSGTHLNLITCTGSWDAADRRFSKRLVVFSDKSL